MQMCYPLFQVRIHIYMYSLQLEIVVCLRHILIVKPVFFSAYLPRFVSCINESKVYFRMFNMVQCLTLTSSGSPIDVMGRMEWIRYVGEKKGLGPRVFPFRKIGFVTQHLANQLAQQRHVHPSTQSPIFVIYINLVGQTCRIYRHHELPYKSALYGTVREMFNQKIKLRLVFLFSSKFFIPQTTYGIGV